MLKHSKHNFILLFISFLFCFEKSKVFAQDSSSSANDSSHYEADENSLFPLPVVYYTPESGLFFGASLLYNFYIDRKKPINPSQLQLAAGYTTKDQLLIFIPFQLYWDQNNWRSTGEVGYYNYAYPFYGIGNNAKPDEFSTYRAKFPRLRVFLQKQTKANLFLGLRYWLENYNIIEWDSTGTFKQSDFSGAEYNRTSGIGPALTYDTRDAIYYPRKGHYLESYLEWNNKLTGSTHNYFVASVDYAFYYSVFDKSVFAINAFSVAGVGDIPFNRLGQLGGNKKMRGYFQGYFQDNNLLLGQLEWRQELFWRIGIVGFGSFGQVANKLSDYGMDRWHFAGGAGLRFAFDTKKHINVRLDYALGKESSGFYISFNEAF